METGFDGVTGGPVAKRPGELQDSDRIGAQPEQDFTGMGSWLEESDETVFKTADGLVLRQELIAQNNLALDTHYTRVKLGYPFSELVKDPNKDTYRATLPAGTKSLQIQAVPNQAWDLVNKATETIWVDPPQPHPSPLNDSEEASSAAAMAERFLVEDGGSKGTDDLTLFSNGTDKALTCATSYIEGWVDPVGGGYVPLQILAHPQAQSPDNPLIGPDGMPTSDPVLRYVTAPVGGQFTNDPSQAAPQWQPRIMGTMWGRENWRVYPESVPVSRAEKAIGLLFCTLAEAKRRWPKVAEMNQDELNTLLSWTPPRFLVLLPPFQRARYKLSNGSDKEKSGSSDERIMFYYRVLQKAAPDHPKGAEVIVTGAASGMVLHKALLAMTLDVPSSDGAGPKKEVRCMRLPLIQVTPREDPDERNPQGRSYMELFSGGTEFNAALATGYLEAMNQWLHPDSYIKSTSPVQGFQVEESRATGDMIPLTSADDKPIYGNMPPIPANFWQGVEWNDEKIRSIASLNKPVTGSDDQQEVSGKARQIAVQQAMISLSRMQRPVMAAYSQWCDVKVELAMRDYSTAQVIRYVGEDGSYKEQSWKGVDFALVGNVGIQEGTGTMMPPEQKVNYISTLAANGMLPPEEAQDAARPTFAQRLGLPDDPHKQYIERCVSKWLEGPPKAQPSADPMQPAPPDWPTQWRGYMQQKQQYDLAQQQAQMQAQHAQALTEHDASQGMAPLPAPSVQPQLPPPQMPWTPFEPRPNETEPPIALLWMRRLSKVMSTVKYSAMPPEWRQCLDQRYEAARQVVAAASQPAPEPGQPQGKASPQQPKQPQPANQPRAAA